MVFLSVCTYLCRVDRAVVLGVKLSGRGAEAYDEWIDLAAEADTERSVEKRREQGECGGHGPDDAGAGEEADGADGGEDEADELREAERCDRFAFTPGASRGATRVPKIRPYGLRRGPVAAPAAKTTACSASRIPAATSENVDTTSTATRTAVVTQAANRGPRTSTCSSSSVVDMRSAPALSPECLPGAERRRKTSSSGVRSRARNPRCQQKATALVISNRYSNKPRGGTGLLCGDG